MSGSQLKAPGFAGGYLHELKLEHVTILYPGAQSYALADRVTVVPLEALAQGDTARLLPARKRR